MERQQGAYSQGMTSSWFMRGMSVPGGGGVVMPNGLAGAQGRDTFAWEGNKDNRDDQLCGSISFKLSDYSTVFGEGKGVSPKGFHGGYAARDTGRLDSAWDIHARDVGIGQARGLGVQVGPSDTTADVAVRLNGRQLLSRT